MTIFHWSTNNVRNLYISDVGLVACLFLAVTISNSVISAYSVDKTDIEIEPVINSDNGINDADKRGSFSRILRSESTEEDAYNRILRGASFSRILRSPKSSFTRILRAKPRSFSRILRGSFARILRSPKSFSRIVRASPAQFSRILRDPQDIQGHPQENSAPRPSRAYTRILRADPQMETLNYGNEDSYGDTGSDGFSRILRDSFSRIL